MKVILQKELEKLGAPGDLVEVADGYARNFLIPRGMAAPASKGGVKHAERLKRAHDERVRRRLEDARATAQKMSSSPLRIPARAGDEGRLFGSITAADVAREIEALTGVKVDRREVHLPESIRSLGAHEVQVRVDPEVTATVTVEVVPQN